MLFLGSGAHNYGKVSNVLNQEICYIKGGVVHNKVGDYEYECSDIYAVVCIKDHIVLNHVSDDTCIV